MTERVTYDLVIFDCDGVLVDTEPIHDRIFAELATTVGLVMSAEEINNRFRGLSTSSSVAIVEELVGRPVPLDFVDNMERLVAASYPQELKLVDGVVEALDRISVPVCVASSGKLERVQLILEMMGIADRFHGNVFSGAKVAHGKPAPDLFVWAARAMGADPGRCAVIEDSVFGVQAGVAAGMKVFGYAGGIEPDLLAREGAHVFGDMRELPGLISG